MANSKRELILDDIKTTLAAITTGGGYNFSVGECKRLVKHFNEVPEDLFPALYVAGADQKIINSTNSHFTAELTTHIIGYVKTADSALPETLETDLNSLIEDVIKALYVDPTRSSNARYTQVEMDHTSKGTWTPFAGFELTVRCEYRSAFTAP